MDRRQFLKLTAAIAAAAALPTPALGYERGERLTDLTELRRSYFRAQTRPGQIPSECRAGHRAFARYEDLIVGRYGREGFFVDTRCPRDNLLFKGRPLSLDSGVHPDEFVWDMGK